MVACSGGPDSLALARAAAFVVPRLGGSVGACVVDHALQPGSADAARQAARTCAALGLEPVRVAAVEVVPRTTGIEDAARTARLAALLEVAHDVGAGAVLMGHTLDDQAEQVLLGLVRGSGARSLAGMPALRPLGGPSGPGEPDVWLLRPFLGVSRQQTAQACLDAGITPWHDPHNADPRFTRVRVRRLLGELESGLDHDLRTALARSADLIRVDSEALDEISDATYRELGPLPWPVTAVAAHPTGIRTRLWRRIALEAGVPGSDLKAVHLRAVDTLVADWHGQAPVELPGGCSVHRREGLIWLRARGEG